MGGYWFLFSKSGSGRYHRYRDLERQKNFIDARRLKIKSGFCYTGERKTEREREIERKNERERGTIPDHVKQIMLPENQHQ